MDFLLLEDSFQKYLVIEAKDISSLFVSWILTSISLFFSVIISKNRFFFAKVSFFFYFLFNIRERELFGVKSQWNSANHHKSIKKIKNLSIFEL